MLRLSVIALALCGILTTAAMATPLDTAVSVYNTKAALLDGAWTDFQAAQSDTFGDVDDALTNMYEYYYYLGEDTGDDATRWNAHRSAWNGVGSKATGLDYTFTGLLEAFDGASGAFAAVLTEDAADSTYVAYLVGGSPHFEVPSQPFMFWRAEGDPARTEWEEFTFSVLAVGLASSYSSVSGTGLTEFVGCLSDAGDWADFGGWYNEHRDDGDEINADGAEIFDYMCLHCPEPTVYLFPHDACFTEEGVENFCEADVCDGPGSESDQGKNAALSDQFACHKNNNIERVADAAEDYVIPWWQSLLPWLFE